MDICLFGPNTLSDLDKEDIFNNIDDFLNNGHTIHLLAYRSIELEVFKFFIQKLETHPMIARQLHIYTFQPLSLLTEKNRISIDFLIEEGTKYTCFDKTPSLMNGEYFIKRDTYIECLKKIIGVCDLTVSFYDGKKSALMIPIDISNELNVQSIVYPLPIDNITLFETPTDEKIKVFKKK